MLMPLAFTRSGSSMSWKLMPALCVRKTVLLRKTIVAVMPKKITPMREVKPQQVQHAELKHILLLLLDRAKKLPRLIDSIIL